MLEGLDQIDWTKVGGHVYASRPVTHIPGIIRDVLSDDEDVQRDALDFLFGSGQDTGNIHDTTPFIVPFILEILADESAPAKSSILQRLVDISGLHVYTGGRGHISIHDQRNQISTYEALESGIPVYVKLLKHDTIRLRVLAAQMLSAMGDSIERVIPVLVEHFDEEADESVQAALVEAVGKILAASDTRRIELHKQYAGWFRQLVETHPMQGVRQAAARACIPAAAMSLWNQWLRDDDVSPRAAVLLVEEYLTQKKGPPGNYERAQIVQLLAQLNDYEPLLGLLEHPDTTPSEAQILIRGLLWRLMQNGKNADRFWQQRLSWRAKEEHIYHMNYSHKVAPMGIVWKKIFERILAVDQIWAYPTNVFSFFFELPDSREELRALIEKS